MNSKHIRSIIVITVISCMLMLLIEQVLQVSYVTKTAAKVLVFLVTPLAYIRFILKENISDFLHIKRLELRQLKIGLLFGLAAFCIVLLAFLILRDFISADVIIFDLKNRLEITAEIYLFIAIYITFGNSLLEEFYFRGFIFLKIYQTNRKLLAYLFSSALFAIYHVAIFATWFNVWLILLALIGLFIIGLLFNWLNTKSGNFLNSWVLHIMADIAVVSIGYYLFSIA